jgi:hypothetical protein
MTRHMPDTTITSADGTTLAARRSGRGSPLVLVHGAIGDVDTFALIEGLLAERHSVWVYSRRGWGGSGDGRDYSLQSPNCSPRPSFAGLRAAASRVRLRPELVCRGNPGFHHGQRPPSELRSQLERGTRPSSRADRRLGRRERAHRTTVGIQRPPRRRLGGAPDRGAAAHPCPGIGALVGLRCVPRLDRP